MNDYQPPIELYQKLNPLLQSPLDYENTDHLKAQLADLTALRYEISLTKAKWHTKLLKERERLRVPKSSEYTELDRNTMLGAYTSVINEDYEMLVSLEQIVTETIGLGIAFLQV